MHIEAETIDNGALKVSLRGRFDVLGAQAIDMKFTALTATQKAGVLVDMADVTFLASLGMRTLISSAKALSNRGGHMVILNPQPSIYDVMETSGLTQLIPVYHDLHEALDALAARLLP